MPERDGERAETPSVAAVLFVILLSLIPVALVQRLTRDTGVLRRVAAPAAAVE